MSAAPVREHDELPVVDLPATILDLGAIDPQPLDELLDRLSEQFWSIENDRKENAFDVFHSTEHIIFRFLADAADPRTHYDNPSWPIVAPIVEPVLRAVVESYGFGDPVICKAMFARLAAHATIDRHRDAARGNELCHKIHIPVRTNPGAWFRSGNETRHLERGRAYEVNNVQLHSAGNDGDSARIHFIFEVYDGSRSTDGVGDEAGERCNDA